MNTQELIEILSKNCYTKSSFQGVYPSDLLPAVVKDFPASFVANVDSSSQPGSHWVAFYFTNNKQGEFFDSYGQSPQTYSSYFKDFLDKNAVDWIYNKKHLQSIFTNVCGHYCIFFLYHRCKNMSMNDIVNFFTSNVKEENDSLVRYFVERNLIHPVVVKRLFNVKVQCCQSLREF